MKTLLRFVLAIVLLVSCTSSTETAVKVVAHRGYWDCEGSAQNSIAALDKAAELGVFGAELDVWVTEDDVVVLNHDGYIDGFSIEYSAYDEIKDIVLENGEKLPTLEQYLDRAKKYPKLKLLVELKDHAEDVNDKRVVEQVAKLTKGNKQVEFISFNADMCSALAKLFPNTTVAYLAGADASPKEIFDRGIPDVDYFFDALRQHPEWVEEAHNLGMSVNVWTINYEDMVKEMIDFGVDIITTDIPIQALEICNNEVTQ